MARKIATRPATIDRPGFQPRELLLAGIGAVSLGRKRVIQSYSQATGDVESFRERAQLLVKDAETAARKLGKQVQGEALKFRSKAEKQLAPVLSRFGVKAALPVKRRRKAA